MIESLREMCQIRSYFRSVFSCIRTRNNSVFGTFHSVSETCDVLCLFIKTKWKFHKKTNKKKLPTSPSYLTGKRLITITFSAEDIGKIIRSLSPNKAHDCDNFSIRMLKLCGDTICEPLQIIFNQALISGSFLSDSKKANIALIHKNSDKQTLKNYRPVSLLPNCSKIFEKIIFNEMFRFFLDNKLITTNQSGFKPGDSCINQLLSILHEIYKSFDDRPEVRSFFLHISKAFEKVWHEGIIFKLEQNGISPDLLNILADF